MAEKIQEHNKIAAYMTVFLVHPLQVGVGILGYQSYLAKYAGYDSWISVLFAGLGVSFVLWVIYAILNKGQGSLITIHKDVFGRWLGGVLSSLFLLYLFIVGVMVIRTYSEVVQVWLFPEMPMWLVSLMLLALVYYTIIGGFRAVIGMCFFGFFIPFIAVLPAFLPLLGLGHFANLLPIWSHSFTDILQASKEMTITIVGFEVILIAYPFIQKPRTSQKWAQLSNGFTILLYEFITVLSFAYYNTEELKMIIWPTLSMLKIVEFPFLERFEYFAISIWLLGVLPTVIVMMWAATRGTKVLCGWRQKKILPFFIMGAFVLSLFFVSYQDVTFLNKFVKIVGFYLLFCYLPFLWIVQKIQVKVRKKS